MYIYKYFAHTINGDLYMKISFLKYYKDKESFNMLQKLGMDVYEVKEPEQIDNIIENLKQEKYTSVVIPNDLASFSENIISKYQNDNNFNIVIIPNSNRKHE